METNLVEERFAKLSYQAQFVCAYLVELEPEYIQLIKLALLDAVKKGRGLDSSMHLNIDANEFCDSLGIVIDDSYNFLEKVGEELFNKEFIYEESDEDAIIRSRWISSIGLCAGGKYISISPTLALVDTILEMYGDELFTSGLEVELNQNQFKAISKPPSNSIELKK